MPYECPVTPEKIVAYVKSLNHPIWRKPHYLLEIRKIAESVKQIDLHKIQRLSEQEVKEEENRCISEIINVIMRHDFPPSSASGRTIFINKADIDDLCLMLCVFVNPSKVISKDIENILKKIRKSISTIRPPENPK